MAALGDRFRAAREVRGLTLSEVAEQIRIRSVYLAAIEEENWVAIGAPVYVRGFLRTYARFLGLDPEAAVADFRESASPPDADDASPYQGSADPAAAIALNRAPPRNLSPLIWIAALVAVVLIGFVFYEALQRPSAAVALASATPASAPLSSSTPGTDSTSTVLGSPLPSGSPVPSASQSPGAASSPGAGGPGSVQVVVAAPSWLRISVDGTVSMVGTFAAGTDRIFHGKYVQMRVGNAGGVTVYVDGKSVGALGKSGAVVDRTFSL